ncbi:hypothetical protein [Massilia sp. TS11]|uniref:hypothetical protein n=1 Tax=Massilia sp. TS11 TaxID=2908003 RepID=UPI001EDA8870|nr:hypothetical protein [Massilia sp. TS11]MCG2585986.1 hypothetical protein [Massilia sp. TS11]
MLSRYRESAAKGKRLQAFLIGEALISQFVPPFVWRDGLPNDDLDVNHRFDLFLADLMWLRAAHARHAQAVRYKRCKLILSTVSQTVFHREAEYMYWQGRRPAWKLVASLSMTDDQQWDCGYLRAAAIKKRALATAELAPSVGNPPIFDAR